MPATQDPFVVVPTYVIREAPEAISTYCAVRSFANYETGECWPSIETVAEMIGKSRSTIKRRLRDLEAIGAIERASKTGASNVYRFPPTRFTHDPGGRSRATRGVGHGRTPNENQRTRTREQEKKTPAASALAERRRDLLWESFVAVHGDPATSNERGKYNAIVKTLREANVAPDEYPSLVAAFTAKYDGLQPAAATIAQRVGELRHFVAQGPVRTINVENEARWAALEREEARRIDAGT